MHNLSASVGWLHVNVARTDIGGVGLAFSVFQYIALRGILSAMTALIISTLVGPKMISWLQEMQIGQAVRVDGPQSHLSKAGTPWAVRSLSSLLPPPFCFGVISPVNIYGSLSQQLLLARLAGLTTTAKWLRKTRAGYLRDGSILAIGYWRCRGYLLVHKRYQTSETTLYVPFLRTSR